jgi:hypothetical protein
VREESERKRWRERESARVESLAPARPVRPVQLPSPAIFCLLSSAALSWRGGPAQPQRSLTPPASSSVRLLRLEGAAWTRRLRYGMNVMAVYEWMWEWSLIRVREYKKDFEIKRYLKTLAYKNRQKREKTTKSNDDEIY